MEMDRVMIVKRLEDGLEPVAEIGTYTMEWPLQGKIGYPVPARGALHQLLQRTASALTSR